MAQKMDVGSLFRQLVASVGARKDGVRKALRSKTEMTVSRDEAMGIVVITLALMAQQAAEAKHYADQRQAVEHSRPIC